jgi:hypothetical protein
MRKLLTLLALAVTVASVAGASNALAANSPNPVIRYGSEPNPRVGFGVRPNPRVSYGYRPNPRINSRPAA